MRRRRQRGFTLTEMMISVGISSMIAYSIFAVMRVGETQVQATQLKMTIQDSAREGLYKMVQEIRQSAPGRISITNGGAAIEFDVPDPDSAFAEDFSVDWDAAHRIRYTLGGVNGQQILRTDTNTNMTAVIANDVVALDFDNGADPNLVTVTLSVQRALVNGQLVPEEPLQVSGQAEMRNT